MREQRYFAGGHEEILKLGCYLSVTKGKEYEKFLKHELKDDSFDDPKWKDITLKDCIGKIFINQKELEKLFGTTTFQFELH